MVFESFLGLLCVFGVWVHKNRGSIKGERPARKRNATSVEDESDEDEDEDEDVADDAPAAPTPN